MRTSATATAGREERTFSIRSRASLARPTTSYPFCSRSDAMPSRSSASSSATTTRSAAAPSSDACGSAGVRSPGAMSESARNRRPVADVRDLQHVEHVVARILAETDQPVEVYEAALEAIGRAVDCGLGAAWELDPGTGDLRCVRTWSAGGAADEFQAVSESLTLAPGVGLPGRVLATGEPAWLVDVPADPNFPRATAARRDGLRAGFAFPLRSAGGLSGVMEFFARDAREPDERLLATMVVVGSQVGQFV